MCDGNGDGVKERFMVVGLDYGHCDEVGAVAFIVGWWVFLVVGQEVRAWTKGRWEMDGEEG